MGACLAETGNSVCCADIDEKKIGRLKQNDMPIYEPGLEALVERNQKEGRLAFTTDLPEAIASAEVVFIAVGTPPGEDGSADLKHVRKVAELIGRHMTREIVVVTKSTVPVGSASRIGAAVAKEAKFPFHICSNPEFLKEGDAIEDFMRPDRVVLGVESAHARKVMSDVYAPFVRTGKPILMMDIASAEMTKYAANGMLATRISFMNEIANLCDRVGADVGEVRKGIGTDSRIGSSFLFPGIGYGGSCFPKDVKALLLVGKEAGLTLHVVEAVDRVNEAQRVLLVPRIEAHLGGLEGKVVAVWGLAFKPRTDDLREAPALAVIQELLARGAAVRAYDPKAVPAARRLLGDRVTFCQRSYEAVEGADALVLATEWNEFREPDFERVRTLMRRPAIFDGRNIYNPRHLRELGFHYEGIGRR